MTQPLIEQDFKNREHALSATKSFIIQAPAGSGKTELLIQRFLVLLGTVNKPEEILAITFTKKAASEMRARIIKALKFALHHDEPEAAHEKKTWRLASNVLKRDREFNWHLIQNPNQLRILTIDAFCAFLTKQLPLLSQFGSSPDIAHDGEALYREAVLEVLSHIESDMAWSPAIEHLLLHLDNDLNKLSDLLVNLLAKRDQWIHYIQVDTNDDNIRPQLENQLQLVITEKLNAITTLIPKELIPELISIARFAASNVPADATQFPIYACLALTKLPETNAIEKTAWLGIANLLLTKRFTWRKRVDADIGFPPLASLKNPAERLTHNDYRLRLNELIKHLDANEALRLALLDVCMLPEPVYRDEQWQTLSALFHVLKIVNAQLRLTFQRHGKIDFIENAQAALYALGEADNPTDLALALDYQIKHILIDEFQDTSFSQYQLLEKLTAGWDGTDGRTLFVVGDPMQSIYRFREAEVGLFIRMQTMGIGQIQLIPLTLAVNFRSEAAIVNWNNTYFKAMFPEHNDIASGSVIFHESIAFHTKEHDLTHSSVNVNGYLAGDENPQSTDIAKTILSILENNPGESIAILVRSRSHLGHLIPLLKRNQIRYRAVDIDPLAERQIIKDLLSLTCALHHPADRLSWLSILRAPFCGFTLADLLVIAGNNLHATILERLQDSSIQPMLSADGQQRLQRILPILISKITDRERESLRTWIESTWLLLGGPASLADYHDSNDVNAYFNLLDAYTSDQIGFDPIILKNKINTLFAKPGIDDCALQIMTIHTAKGLEFDHVILPHLERKLPHDDKSLFLWMEQPLLNDKVALVLAPIQATGKENDRVYSYIQRQMKLKSDFEVDRLFYVAATRAKKKLYLYFTIKHKAEGDYQLESGSFLAKFWPILEAKQSYIPSSHHHLVHYKEKKSTSRSTLRLVKEWQHPLKETQVKQVISHQKKVGLTLPNQEPRLIGIIIHSILQNISSHGIHWWQAKASDAQRHYLLSQLRQIGVLPRDMSNAIEIAFCAINNTLNDKKGLWILQPHNEAKSEFAISANIDDNIHHLVIDRTFVDETNVRWIIDYKTANLTHDDIQRFLRDEKEKYHEKMAIYRNAMRLIDSRPIRLGLYFPALPAWHEWGEDG